MKPTSNITQRKSLKALLVEDVYDTVRGTMSALQSLGFIIEQASNIEAAEKLLRKTTYDLIIIDVRMPEKHLSEISPNSGIQFLEKLRDNQYGENNSMTPFIIFTAQETANLTKLKAEYKNCIGVYGKLMHLIFIKDVRKYFGEKPPEVR